MFPSDNQDSYIADLHIHKGFTIIIFLLLKIEINAQSGTRIQSIHWNIYVYV